MTDTPENAEELRVERWIKLCRKYGVTRLRLGDMALELSSAPPAATSPDKPPRKLTPEEEQAAEDELLYHSSDPV